MTTIEWYEAMIIRERIRASGSKQPYRHPYDVGYLNNLKQVLGYDTPLLLSIFPRLGGKPPKAVPHMSHSREQLHQAYESLGAL